MSHSAGREVAVAERAVAFWNVVEGRCAEHNAGKTQLFEQLLPFWLDMERTLAAYRTGDRAMLLWNVLHSHQTRTYEQAIEVLQAILADPEHAELVDRHGRIAG